MNSNDLKGIAEGLIDEFNYAAKESIRLYKEGLKNFNSFFLIRYIKYAVYFSFFGFLVFSIAYVSDTGDVIKASYIIQLFHLIVFVASLYFHKLRIINKNAYFITLFLLLVAYTHNFQSYLSNFPAGFYPQ